MPSALDKRVQFNFLYNSVSLRNRLALKRFLVRLLKNEGKNPGALNYIFCSDSYLLKINKKYLNHNFLTDIITFPLSGPMQPIVADIYISLDRVRENSKNFKTSIKQELHRVIFHGALHLCGYKDKSKHEAAKMRKKEEEYLALYFK